VHVTPIAIVPGVDLYPAFIADPETLLARLAGELDLRQEYINLGRGPVAMPRLTGWYGDPGAVYRYSRLVNVPAPWTLALGALRHELNERLGASLNSCLVNSYRDGASSMGWHSGTARPYRIGFAPRDAHVPPARRPARSDARTRPRSRFRFDDDRRESAQLATCRSEERERRNALKPYVS
jgi:hypothetical protein